MRERFVSLTLSHKYEDYLSVCLPSVREVFDESYVVTEPGSLDEEVALKFGAKTIGYTGWSENGFTFNRAGAIRKAQELLHEQEAESWIAIIDADIYLPEESKEKILSAATDKNSLVGIKRVCAHTKQDVIDGRFYYYPHPFSGYFQMYYRKDFFYQELSRDASITDCLFRDNFSVWILADTQCLHLGQQFVNWSGRKSPNWFST